MANAQKMIEERKKALNALKTDTAPPTKADTTVSSKPNKGLLPPPASVQRTEEKAKKIAQLQVKS